MCEYKKTLIAFKLEMDKIYTVDADMFMCSCQLLTFKQQSNIQAELPNLTAQWSLPNIKGCKELTT